MTTIKETIDRLDPPPPPPPRFPAQKSPPAWERTGSTRYRIGLLGKVILMVEERYHTLHRWRDATQLDLLMSVAVPRERSTTYPWMEGGKSIVDLKNAKPK